MSDLVLNHARAALRSEPRLRPSHTAIYLSFSEGVMTVEGEVENVAAKKLALEHIAAVPGVTGILDRLRVSPAQKMGDGEVRD
jgi:osmotically-inducible protein OsmY